MISSDGAASLTTYLDVPPLFMPCPALTYKKMSHLTIVSRFSADYQEKTTASGD
jgi:hypothetical protein